MPKIIENPPRNKWQISSRKQNSARDALSRVVNQNASKLGLAPIENINKIIATGHQPWLWHPGILAKDIATKQAAKKLGAQALHLIVDQDVHPALNIELPIKQGNYLDIYQLNLGEQNPTIPTGFHPPVETKKIIDSLKNIKVTKNLAIDTSAIDRLIEVFNQLPKCSTLAQQFAVALYQLKSPYANEIPLIFTSDLAGMDEFKNFVNNMLLDARRCVNIYNRTVNEYPQAGMALLQQERERVQLPLWACTWNMPRQNVYADLGDSKNPLLVFEDGGEIDQNKITIMPKALAMTAFLRYFLIDFFIHGKGGGVYEQITKQWWESWRGDTLAPLAVVSADLFLNFNAPVATKKELEKAKWYRHWIAHNIDRVDGANCKPDLIKEKNVLLKHMDDDRDKQRRKSAFNKIHTINKQLIQDNLNLINEADYRLDSAIAGNKNLAIAKKRDWCFALYDDKKLSRLVEELLSN